MIQFVHSQLMLHTIKSRTMIGIVLLIILFGAGCSPSQNSLTPTLTLNPPSIRTPISTDTPNTQIFDQTEIPTPLSADARVDRSNLTNNQFLFGTESRSLDFQGKEPLIQGLGVSLIRYNGLLWTDVEPNEGIRDWSALKEFDERLENAAQLGLSLVLIVRRTPEWAQQVPGVFCGPVKVEKLQAFADFMQEAVIRYSAPPYNVKLWELGNEPDVDPSLVKPDSIFGCWGDQNDPGYGGGYYAEMLKVVYPAIKAADPAAKVLIGGLLLDCDPTNPPPEKNCDSGNFLEGILQNGGGEYFDYVSFHGYPFYGGISGQGELYYDVNYPGWEHRGGIVLGKIAFIREVLGKHGYGVDKPEKQLMHTEGSLICNPAIPDCDPPIASFYEAQADYVVWMYVRNWANNVKATMWYLFEGPGWRQGALLDKDQNPKPVYDALKFLVKELAAAEYVGTVENITPLIGYEFKKDSTKVLVIWSPDGQSHPLTLNLVPNAIYDKYGEVVDSSSAEMQVNSPIYIELHQ
jgi:hypothetical protein